MTEPKQETAKRAPREGVMGTGKVTFMYMGWNEAGEFETFSDELEACRFALKGASKARVEKRELKKRAK